MTEPDLVLFLSNLLYVTMYNPKLISYNLREFYDLKFMIHDRWR